MAMVALEHLSTAGFDPSRPVCRMPERTWGELLAHAAGYAHSLEKMRSTESGALVALDSGFLFLAALMACWSRGITPVVPPDTQPETLRVLAPFVCAILTDRAMALAGRPQLEPTRSSPWQPGPPCAPEAVALELFTSGSSGDRRRIPKRFRQLNLELANLDALWGKRLHDTIPVATVSHLHIYGLLFRLLWPVCRGQPFLDRSIFQWEEILGVNSLDRLALVSSPSHLRHFVQAMKTQEASIRQATLFSSGGPLSRETALGIRAWLGEAPIEVFGSTETGGIAWRQQTGGADAAWIPFTGVHWEAGAEGNLRIHSPLLEDPHQWHETGDRAVAAEQEGFRLMGRGDRLAKIFEKRVSLTEMERILSKHPLLEGARVVMVAPAEGNSERPAAAVVLNGAGREALQQQGKSWVVRELKDRLKEHYEAAVLPRYWRFVDAWPCDAQGKVTPLRLAALFRPAAKLVRLDAALEKSETVDGGLCWHLRIPVDLDFFPGHFPKFPVVPGVCALRWVLEAIASLRGVPSAILEMSAVKFHHFLRPGNRCQLEVKENSATGWWAYRLFGEDKKFASGRLRLDS